jgi:ABC-type dipeptide/oligopeptide/nickel transport system permease component
MLLFLVRRAIAALALVFIVTSSAVLLAGVSPGDYATSFGRTAEQIASERHRLGLDLPVGRQYTRWLTRAVTFDFGESFQYQQPVMDLVRQRAANTALLALSALVVATLMGIPAGVMTGSRRSGLLTRLIRGASLVLLSVPPLIGSLVLITIAARTGWLPVSGMEGPASFVVPTLALALPIAATLERLQSQSIREALQRPSMIAAASRGVPGARLVWRHGWRLSLGPLLAIYGVIVGSLFSGSFAVEMVTSWPGLGALMRQALMMRDTYLVAGCAAAGAACLAAGVLATDVAHAFADPRVRGAGGRA